MDSPRSFSRPIIALRKKTASVRMESLRFCNIPDQMHSHRQPQQTTAGQKPGVDGVIKGGAEVVGKKSWGKGMRIAISEDNSLNIGCNIIVRYGESVIDVAKSVQNAVRNAVESVTGCTVTDVNVNVCGIIRK